MNVIHEHRKTDPSNKKIDNLVMYTNSTTLTNFEKIYVVI